MTPGAATAEEKEAMRFFNMTAEHKASYVADLIGMPIDAERRSAKANDLIDRLLHEAERAAIAYLSRETMGWSARRFDREGERP